jgi:hypothetical protein
MTVTRSFLTDLSLWSWARKAAPSSGTFYVGLSTIVSPTEASGIETFVGGEIIGNGYARQPVAFASDGTFNAAAYRHEMPQLQASFTAASGSIIWRTAFVLYGAAAASSVSITTVTPATDTITTSAAHSLTVGDPVMIQDTGILGMPGGLTSGILYYVHTVPTTTTFTLRTTAGGSTIVDITSAGSSTYALKYAKGGVRSFVIRPSNETITAGSTGRVNYDPAMLETTYV